MCGVEVATASDLSPSVDDSLVNDLAGDSRHDVANNLQLGRDLMGPLAADRAFLCAELRSAGTAAPLIVLPQGLGCKGSENDHHVRVDVGNDGAMSLLLRFSNAEIATSREQRRSIVLAVVIVSILCAVVAATVGFRFIVGGPLQRFSAAIRTSVETGRRTKVDISRNDELGQVHIHYILTLSLSHTYILE